MRRPTFIARQAGHPAGWFGRFLLRVMARETSAFNREVLDALAIVDGERVLEVGFGHGQTLRDAAALTPGARFAGIDIAPDAQKVASRRCRALIEAGRLELQTGDAAALPWSDSSFEAVYSVHTIYFWQHPENVLAEIRRVLSRPGRLVIGMRDRTDDAATHFPASVYRFHSGDEVALMLRAAGFSSVEVRTAAANANLRVVVATT